MLCNADCGFCARSRLVKIGETFWDYRYRCAPMRGKKHAPIKAENCPHFVCKKWNAKVQECIYCGELKLTMEEFNDHLRPNRKGTT